VEVVTKDFDCMFHDEGIPDAPCNCATGEAMTGSHNIVSDKAVTPVAMDLHGCARCRGEGHKALVFLPLEHPVEVDDVEVFSHWAICPTNGEPILMGYL
jgi:hypothetical protein